MSRVQHYQEKKDYRISQARAQHILDLLPLNAHTILDLGCGIGDLAKLLTEKGYIVTGADISQKSIENAKKHAKETFVVDFENSWPNELLQKKFDVIIASEIIEHMFNPDFMLQNISIMLHENSVVIITTPNIVFWKSRFNIFFGNFEYTDKGIMDKGHVHFFTLKTLKKLCKKYNFKIEKEHHVFPNLEHRKLNFLGQLFPSFFAYQLVVSLRHE